MKKTRVLLFVLSILFILGSPVFIVWKQSHITQVSFTEEKLRDQLNQLRREKAKAEIRLERLGRDERIERIAKERCGLRYPDSRSIVIVNERPSRSSDPFKRLWRMVARFKSDPNEGA